MEQLNEKQWKALLTRLKHEYMKRSTPAAFAASGGYSMKLKPYTDKNTNGLTRCVEDFINYHPSGAGQATRVNSTGVPERLPSGEIRWRKSNTRKGIADIIGSWQGRYLALEVKIGRDKMSEAQHREQERITRTGGLYYAAKTFPAFLEWWQEQGFELPRFEPIPALQTEKR